MTHDSDLTDLTASQMHMPPPRTRQQGYVFAAENPFRDDLESFAKVRCCRHADASLFKHLANAVQLPTVCACLMLLELRYVVTVVSVALIMDFS